MCPKKDGVYRQLPDDTLLREKKKKHSFARAPDWYPSGFSGKELKKKIEALPAEAQKEIGYQEGGEGDGSWGFSQRKANQETCLVCPEGESPGILGEDNPTNVCNRCTASIKKDLESGSPEGMLEGLD